MASKVQPRPTYYEMLGLTAAASATDINAAFAKKISLFAAASSNAAAEVCIAYETLHNPVRRRDYDLALGLTGRPCSPPKTLSIAMPQQRWEPFIASVAAEPADQHLAVQDSGWANSSTPQSREAAPPRAFADVAAKAGPKTPSSRLNVNGARKEAPPAVVPRERRSGAALVRPVGQDVGRNEVIGWSRTGFAMGGIILAVVVLGAWAGTVAGNDAETADHASLHPLGNVKHVRARSVSAGTLSVVDGAQSSAAEPSLIESRRAAEVPLQRRHRGLAQRRSRHLETQTTEVLPSQSPDSDALLQPAAADDINVAMPLPRSVIAHTIDRIGFRCGEVSSARPSGSTPGVFMVSCTSGDSYQATPVSGRYHFRRVGGG